MRKRLAVVIAALVVLFVAGAVAQTSPEFSGDLSMKTPQGENASGKIYFGGTKSRMDMQARGHRSEVITDLAAKKVFIIVPDQHMYMEHDVNQAGGPKQRMDVRPRDPNNPCSGDPNHTCKQVGSETVNGRDCTKWEFTNKQSGKVDMTEWIDKKIPIAIRSLHENGTELDLLNIKEGHQDPSLFDIPSGFKKMDVPVMTMPRGPQQ